MASNANWLFVVDFQVFGGIYVLASKLVYRINYIEKKCKCAPALLPKLSRVLPTVRTIANPKPVNEVC